MAKKTWTITIDGAEHKIDLDHGSISGKRIITLDGMVIEESSKPLDTGSDHAFQIGNHICTIHIHPQGLGFKYDLSMDGVSVTSGKPTQINELSPHSPLVTESTLIQQQIKLENQLKGGANWFFWVAGLSLVNTVVFLFDGTINFVVGLGITQIIDGLALYISTELNPEIALFIQIVGLGINLIILGIFVLFGVMARKRKNWAFVTGMILYALDVLILIWASDLLSILFHAFALYGMFQGLRAVRKLAEFKTRKIDSPGMVPD